MSKHYNALWLGFLFCLSLSIFSCNPGDQIEDNGSKAGESLLAPLRAEANHLSNRIDRVREGIAGHSLFLVHGKLLGLKNRVRGTKSEISTLNVLGEGVNEKIEKIRGDIKEMDEALSCTLDFLAKKDNLRGNLDNWVSTPEDRIFRFSGYVLSIYDKNEKAAEIKDKLSLDSAFDASALKDLGEKAKEALADFRRFFSGLNEANVFDNTKEVESLLDIAIKNSESYLSKAQEAQDEVNLKKENIRKENLIAKFKNDLSLVSREYDSIKKSLPEKYSVLDDNGAAESIGTADELIKRLTVSNVSLKEEQEAKKFLEAAEDKVAEYKTKCTKMNGCLSRLDKADKLCDKITDIRKNLDDCFKANDVSTTDIDDKHEACRDILAKSINYVKAYTPREKDGLCDEATQVEGKINEYFKAFKEGAKGLLAKYKELYDATRDLQNDLNNIADETLSTLDSNSSKAILAISDAFRVASNLLKTEDSLEAMEKALEKAKDKTYSYKDMIDEVQRFRGNLDALTGELNKLSLRTERTINEYGGDILKSYKAKLKEDYKKVKAIHDLIKEMQGLVKLEDPTLEAFTTRLEEVKQDIKVIRYSDVKSLEAKILKLIEDIKAYSDISLVESKKQLRKNLKAAELDLQMGESINIILEPDSNTYRESENTKLFISAANSAIDKLSLDDVISGEMDIHAIISGIDDSINSATKAAKAFLDKVERILDKSDKPDDVDASSPESTTSGVDEQSPHSPFP